MRYRLMLVGEWAGSDMTERAVVCTASATTTVSELASALIRAGGGRSQLLAPAMRRHASFTLRVVVAPGGRALILDGGQVIAQSGLRSGAQVEPVAEMNPGLGDREHAVRATVTICSGPQRGVVFPLSGEAILGRGRGHRVQLHDPGVSKGHARLGWRAGNLVLHDLGATNGIHLAGADGSSGERVVRVVIRLTQWIRLGSLLLCITPVEPTGCANSASGSSRQPEPQHVQSPQLFPVYLPEVIVLPDPPAQRESQRLPLVLMLGPVATGGVMYLVTQSPISAVLGFLMPMMLLGQWTDGRVRERRASRKREREYRSELHRVSDQVIQDLGTEKRLRLAESRSAAELLSVAAVRGPALWGRRPEHRQFLELRLGTGTLRSRREVQLPARGEAVGALWEELREIQQRATEVVGVPVLERLDRCGSLAICGPNETAAAALRAILVQLCTLHSPEDLSVVAFASREQAGEEWSWVAWLPHAHAPDSRISAAPLVVHPDEAAELLAALEQLIRQRGGGEPGTQVYSSLLSNAADAAEVSASVTAVLPGRRVVVLVLASDEATHSRLLAIAETGPAVGVHLVWNAERLDRVPAGCRTVVRCDEGDPEVLFSREARVVQLSDMDTVTRAQAERCARDLALANAETGTDSRASDRDLPRTVALVDLLDEDVLHSASAISLRWTRHRSLVRDWREGARRASEPLAAVVGQGTHGRLVLDLRAHGPHALVGGTTGSGKSEFLQSWILSLAMSYSPDRVNFLFLDFKGGAAFATCADLPHTVGLVTDLTGSLATRVLVSLRAELHRREELLARKHAAHLEVLEQRSDRETPPSVIVVIDEFAVLAAELPEFVAGVMDIAQRGRSLGLHLILATQRPAGSMSENLRANITLRVGMRMASAADSRDVLGTADAALLHPEVRGRGLVSFGSGRVVPFQAGYVGGSSGEAVAEQVEIRLMGFGKGAPLHLQPENVEPQSPTEGMKDIEQLVRMIRSAAEASGCADPRRLWLEELPLLLPLAQLGQAQRHEGQLLLGLQDDPAHQQQLPFRLPFAGLGNCVWFGGPGMGKTTALLTAAVAVACADPRAVIYGIDAGGGGLSVLRDLPHVGDIVPHQSAARVSRLLTLVRDELENRAGTASDRTPLVLLIDGFAAFRERFEHLGAGSTVFEDLVAVARTGRAVGGRLFCTAEHAGALPQVVSATVTERLAFWLPTAQERYLLGVPAGQLTAPVPGRAVHLGKDAELQLAIPGERAGAKQIAAAVRRLGEAPVRGAQTSARWGGAVAGSARSPGQPLRPVSIPEVPSRVARAELVLLYPESPGVCGIDTERLACVEVPDSGEMVITGPSGSGRSTAIRTLIQACVARAAVTGSPSSAVFIGPERSEVLAEMRWRLTVHPDSEAADVYAEITAAVRAHGMRAAEQLTDRAAARHARSQREVRACGATGVHDRNPAAASRDEGPLGLIVVEDLGAFAGSACERHLANLLRLLRRSRMPSIVEGENTTIAASWELGSAVKGAPWMVALQPDSADTPSVFTASFPHARRAEYPHGRGLLVRAGVTTGVHFATPCAGGPGC